MLSIALNSGFNNFSQKIADLLSVFAPNNNHFTKVILKRLGEKSQELYSLTKELIDEVDSESFENATPLNGIQVILPLIDMLKHLDIDSSSIDNELRHEFIENIELFKRAINLVSDFIEALEQYFEDEGKNKLTYYIYLIDEYRECKEENLELNKKYRLINIQEWA